MHILVPLALFATTGIAPATCKHCRGPVVTRPSEKYPEGRPIEGAEVCEDCACQRCVKPEPKRYHAAADAIIAAMEAGAETVQQIARVTGKRSPRVWDAMGRLVRNGRAEKVAVTDGCGYWRLVA